MKIVKNIKISIRNIKNLLPSPTKIKSGFISFLKTFPDAIQNCKLFIKDAKKSYKNLYENNMKLAVFHLENGNIFDAALRYKIAHRFDKTRSEPLLGLAYVSIQRKQNQKAIKYFQSAIALIQNEEDKKQIEKIIYEISA